MADSEQCCLRELSGDSAEQRHRAAVGKVCMGACVCCLSEDKGRPADSPSPDRVPGGWGDFFASGLDLLPAWTPEVARKRGGDCVRVKAGDVDNLLEKISSVSMELDIVAVNKVGLQLGILCRMWVCIHICYG